MGDSTIAEAKSRSKRTIKPDFRVGKLSLIGLGGLILGCIILFYPDLTSPFKADPVFHEVKYVPKLILGDRIDSVIDSLEKEDSRKQFERSAKLKLQKKLEKDEIAKDSLARAIAAIDKALSTLASDVKILKGYRESYLYTSEADSASFYNLNNALHFDFSPQMLRDWDQAYKHNRNENVRDVHYTFKDKNLSFSINGTGKLRIEDAPSDISFISRHPAAGIWVLLIMAFCSFLLIAISTCFYLKDKIALVLTDKSVGGLTKPGYQLLILPTLLSLFLIWLIGKLSFNDEEVVRGIYFLRHLESSMYLMQTVGFLAGACCLAGFIYTSSLLVYFARQVKDKRGSFVKAFAKIEEQRKRAEADDQERANVEHDIRRKEEGQAALEANIKEDKEIFKKLSDVFQTFFYLSAVILSLLVLCTGGLYGIINGLDFVKMMTNDWGFSPVPNDYIYLYGGFYTIIMLLVYLPAKMRFSEISFPPDPKEEGSAASGNSEDQKKWLNILKNPFSRLSDLLVAASPLLASLVQSLFEALFN